MSHLRSSRLAATSLACLLLPAAAQAAPLTSTLVFLHAAPLPKLIMLGLVCATLAAMVVCAAKLAAGPRRAGGSAFVSGLRLGGPMAGGLGAAYAALHMAFGVANLPVPPPINVLAPGVAEVVLLIGLGLMAGTVAAIANWALEARIDRAVLGA